MRRHPELQRQEQPRPNGAVLRLRHGAVVRKADADSRLQLLSRVRISGEPNQASPPATPSPRERLAGKLPRGFGTNGPGNLCRKKLSGSQRRSCSASRCSWCSVARRAYESGPSRRGAETIPLGICGAVIAATCAACRHDVYFTVGLITTSASPPRTPLIIEFAKDLRARASRWSKRRSKRAACVSADPDDGPGFAAECCRWPSRQRAGGASSRRWVTLSWAA